MLYILKLLLKRIFRYQKSKRVWLSRSVFVVVLARWFMNRINSGHRIILRKNEKMTVLISKDSLGTSL